MSVSNVDSPNLSLVADIGGTNARFGLTEGPGRAPTAIRTLPCVEYPSLADAARAYLRGVGDPRSRHAAIAIATPVSSDWIAMTNHAWSFSVEQVRQSLAMQSLTVLNDFTALALSLPHLSAAELHQVGGGEPCPQQAKAVLGPGTGLGVSGLVAAGAQWVPLQSEGGHVTYGPTDEREAGVLSIIRAQFDHVSAERLVSGPGLLLLYRAIAAVDRIAVIPRTPAEITDAALQAECPVAQEALSMLCAILGTVAGNLALTIGAKGGVYIGGGIVPRLGEYFARSEFRARFELRGRFAAYLAGIPTYVIHADVPALRGAAAALAPEYRYLGVASAGN